jgi:predicted nucleic acid-binding protein
VALLKARYLIDKSALARMQLARVQARLGPIIEAGEAASCSIIDLEVLYSARNSEEHQRVRQRRALAYRSVPMTEETFQRAIAVQGLLARSGRHRVPIPDLLIAAAAEAAGLTVLHYDRDYDTIAEVTEQPVEWVVEPGSV